MQRSLWISYNKAYEKQTFYEVHELTEAYFYFIGDCNEVEVGFVDGLFKINKLRELITKATREFNPTT